MTSYLIDPGPRAVTVGRLLDGVRRELRDAFLDQKLQTGLTIKDLALKLAKPCSEINGYFAGTRTLSLRAIADLAWALNKSITLDIGAEPTFEGQNSHAADVSVHYHGSYSFGASTGLTTTAPPPPVIHVASFRPRSESVAA
jgi:hypothetical protein